MSHNMAAAMVDLTVKIVEPHKLRDIHDKMEEVSRTRENLGHVRSLMSVIEARINQDHIDLADQSDLIDKIRVILGPKGEEVFPHDRYAWEKEKAEGLIKTLSSEAHYLTAWIPPAMTGANQVWEELRHIVEIAERCLRILTDSEKRMIHNSLTR